MQAIDADLKDQYVEAVQALGQDQRGDSATAGSEG